MPGLFLQPPDFDCPRATEEVPAYLPLSKKEYRGYDCLLVPCDHQVGLVQGIALGTSVLTQHVPA